MTTFADPLLSQQQLPALPVLGGHGGGQQTRPLLLHLLQQPELQLGEVPAPPLHRQHVPDHEELRVNFW